MPAASPVFGAGQRLLRLRLELVVVLLLGLAVFAWRMDEAPLLDWDEATYAEVAHEAVTNGQYLSFTWNGRPYMKKPLLLFWMLAGSFKTFGESEWSARLPSIVMGIATLLLIYLSADAVAGRLAGIFAALIPLEFYFFVARGGRECATDAPLLFFTTLALYALLQALRNRRWVPIVGIACGLAILSKGLAGLIPAVVAVTAIVLFPGFADIGLRGAIVILAEAAAVSAPWYVYQAVTNYQLFWSTFIVHETVLRVLSHLEDDPQAAGSALATFCGETRHLWPLLIPLAALTLSRLRRGKSGQWRRVCPSTALWAVWLAIALGAACAVQTKLGWYVLPALVPVALLGGTVLAEAFAQSDSRSLYPAIAASIAVVILALGIPGQWRKIALNLQTQQDVSRPGYVMALQAREVAAAHGGGELFFGEKPLPTMVYYSGMRCHFVKLSDLSYQPASSSQPPLPAEIGRGDLVFVDRQGSAVTISNYGDEWARYGPYAGQ
jgi:4-amino-4-deoxy-L-arabinose transferase-like glycosyltransferase